ncbi:regulator of G-protein signaling 3-like [Limanda limanda]|uniref:regulator of G-protein signaling 3-like n=1 Tax=Limanda limanda TaxID=27771 RepID=UPI0029C7495E|nr:regulator of G-protein signaling 3-like [Limanda limanda]
MMHTIHRLCRICIGQNLPQVNIVRGTDGFGFTICSDCPVRVQAVDAAGPAHRSGLRQGDLVLQLNGLPVETWKCVELAHTIRTCPSQIVLVVWRGLPDLMAGSEALLGRRTHNTTPGRRLLPHPFHSKQDRRQGQNSGVRASLAALGSLWRDRKHENEEEEQEVTEYSCSNTTLKGTRVTSSNGDNYIILSPVNPAAQHLHPVCHDRNATISPLYRTHPSRGQNLLHDPRPESSQQLFTSRTTTLPLSSSSSATPSDYGNYQNCTIVQSHLPCSSYESYMTLAPKTLIFPIFVQPLDLCSADRTLLMSEELVLHQAGLLPAKVTVLIYNDVLLLTREDEVGRCNVLQSPVFLNTLQLREVSSEPLLIHLVPSSQTCFRFAFILECFSIEQKIRIRLCLRDNIQLVAMAPSQQLSHLPQDFGLLSLHQSDLLYRSSSPFSSTDPPLTINGLPLSPPLSFPSSSTQSAVWKEKGKADEDERRKRKEEEEDELVEERQQGEGESASETSERVGGGGLLLSPAHLSSQDRDETVEEFDSAHRAAVLRRSLSEGSLLREPPSPHFLSESAIHQLTHPLTSDPDPLPTSPCTLRKQLTSEGGSLQQILLLLNSNKDSEFRNLHLTNKTESLAADVRCNRSFLRLPENCTRFHGNSLEKALRNNRPSPGEVLRWAESLEALLTNQYGLAVFRHFLRSEFSEENLDFWLAVERFKRKRPLMAVRAMKIYEEFMSTTAARQVNLDSTVRESTNQSLLLGVNPASFQLAQDQIFGLIETDSYPRFLQSHLYAQLANHSGAGLVSQS